MSFLFCRSERTYFRPVPNSRQSRFLTYAVNLWLFPALFLKDSAVPSNFYYLLDPFESRQQRKMDLDVFTAVKITQDRLKKFNRGIKYTFPITQTNIYSSAHKYLMRTWKLLCRFCSSRKKSDLKKSYCAWSPYSWRLKIQTNVESSKRRKWRAD